MYNDRQPLDCLNLSIKYVSHWTYLQGLRELYQNFMDACLEKYPEYPLLYRKQVGSKITFTQARRVGNNLEQIDGNFISYDTATKTLIFENHKSFPIKCLLMGCSEKGPDALGQFGEGMKVSMIVLLKTNLDLTIESGDSIYYPTTKDWDHNPLFAGKYEHGVLYVKVVPKDYLDKTKVTVQGVDSGKFQEFLYLSLALLDQTKFQKITCGKSTLIFTADPKLIGKVYKKGVRLQLHESQNSMKFQHYSYNFEEIQVGRQRDCVNNVWDLYRLQSQLHYNISNKLLDQSFLANNPHLKPKLRDHLQNIYTYLTCNNYQTHFFHQYSKNNKILCDLYYGKFLEKNGSPAELYPQYDSVKVTVVRNLMVYGLPAGFYPVVDVSWQLWHTLHHSNKYQAITTKIQTEILNKNIRELTPEQSQQLNQLKSIVKQICPEIENYSFKVKMFKDVLCCKDKDPKVKVIYVNGEKIGESVKMMQELCRMMLG